MSDRTGLMPLEIPCSRVCADTLTCISDPLTRTVDVIAETSDGETVIVLAADHLEELIDWLTQARAQLTGSAS